MGPSGAPASLKNRTPNEKALGKPGLLRLYSFTTSEPHGVTGWPSATDGEQEAEEEKKSPGEEGWTGGSHSHHSHRAWNQG